jgi:hypothetical protein
MSKLDQKRSMFSKEKIPEQPDFDTRASGAIEQNQELVQRGQELTRQYWAVMNDKTLSINKGPLQKSLEKEILEKLANFAESLNNDESKAEGYGSVAMMTLLFKSVFLLKSKNNDLQYELSQVKEQLKSVSTPAAASDDK